MKIKSLLSIVTESEKARDRRHAIWQSWSKQEREVRRKAAIATQLRLVSLIERGEEKSIQIKDLFFSTAGS